MFKRGAHIKYDRIRPRFFSVLKRHGARSRCLIYCPYSVLRRPKQSPPSRPENVCLNTFFLNRASHGTRRRATPQHSSLDCTRRVRQLSYDVRLYTTTVFNSTYGSKPYPMDVAHVLRRISSVSRF